jgi:membrane protein implicated in regulation of membrane protease activity
MRETTAVGLTGSRAPPRTVGLPVGGSFDVIMAPMTILWWHWLVLGLLLVVGELATPGGFYILFFGISALLVGVLAGVGIAGPVWFQVLLFSILAVVGLAVFRTRLLSWMQVNPQAPQIDTLVGEVGTVGEPLAPGSMGKVQLRGASWSARNASDATLETGARCRVVRVDGLTLYVAPEGGR